MQDVKNAMSHLQKHQKYPATRKQLVEECYNLKDFSVEDKKWFEKHLPEGTYNSADEVMQALGMSKAAGMHM